MWGKPPFSVFDNANNSEIIGKISVLQGEKIMYLKKEQAEAKLEDYKREMELQELSERTTHKYLADISQWLEEVQDDIISKEAVILYKKQLAKRYKAASVNSKIISINRYLRWLGFTE